MLHVASLVPARAARRLSRHIARAGVDLLFPPRCLLCRSCLQEVRGSLCDPCQAKLERERAKPACPHCASSVAPSEVHQGRCSACRGRRLPVSGTVRVGHYDDGLGQLTRSYKYQAREEIEPLLARWLAEVATGAKWLHQIEAIVAVPTHWKHRLTRPLYAADALAAAVAIRTGIPRLPVLRRTRAGPHQIGLSYTERVQNVRGAFAVRHRVTLRKARLLLIDDVMTTGATVNECAKVLRGGGAAEVYAAVLVTAGWDRSSNAARLPT